MTSQELREAELQARYTQELEKQNEKMRLLIQMLETRLHTAEATLAMMKAQEG